MAASYPRSCRSIGRGLVSSRGRAARLGRLRRGGRAGAEHEVRPALRHEAATAPASPPRYTQSPQMPLVVDRYELGPIGTNCYVVRLERGAAEAAVVDPGDDAATLRLELAR